MGAKKIAIIVIVVGLAMAGLTWSGYWAYRAFYPVSPDSARIQELQTEIDGLRQTNTEAKAEIDKAKQNAAKAMERARLAQARAEVFSSQAAEWRERYNLAIRQRDNLKRAQTGSEAVKELRRMGWVR